MKKQLWGGHLWNPSYSSYYQGSLDYIESATEDELIETFGEDFKAL